MSQLAVILDNLVKIFENVDGGCHQQPPSSQQEQIFHQQHRSSPYSNSFHRKTAESKGRVSPGVLFSRPFQTYSCPFALIRG
jgi:hypothetical protein